MALFGKKDGCPICGQPVKGMFHTKIKDDVKLCADCAKKISIEFSMLKFQSVDQIKEHLAYREENYKLYQNFSPTNEITCGTVLLREDANLKKWCVLTSKKATNPALFDYDEIIDYEATENGNQVAKGGLGAAVAGGILLGGVGAVVGSNIGKKKSITEVTSMELRISLNNKYHNQIVINAMPFGTKAKTNSPTYNLHKYQLNSAISFLDSICSKAKSSVTSESASVSDADEILKFKQLLDQGIITQEEFDSKKKQLLGL